MPMMDVLKELIKQPYWVIALVLGVVLVAFPCITIDKEYHWVTHPPNTLLPVVVGVLLLLLSLVGFGFTLRSKHAANTRDIAGGLDLTRVKEKNGVLSTTVSGCEIQIVEGRIEDYASGTGNTIVLPCNEYFDDRCVGDRQSSLGAYVNKVFDGQAESFVSLVKDECERKLGTGVVQQKTANERATSFGAGQCLLLVKPLGHSVSVALVSTTTQRPGQGLSSRISYLFDGMRRLNRCLADARHLEVAMPVLGSGHGRLDPPLALVGLLLAIAEAARYGQGGQRLKKVTIVVFKRDVNSAAEVDSFVVRRALALVGSLD